jgi:hypothetical protein
MFNTIGLSSEDNSYEDHQETKKPWELGKQFSLSEKMEEGVFRIYLNSDKVEGKKFTLKRFR